MIAARLFFRSTRVLYTLSLVPSRGRSGTDSEVVVSRSFLLALETGTAVESLVRTRIRARTGYENGLLDIPTAGLFFLPLSIRLYLTRSPLRLYPSEACGLCGSCVREAPCS